MKTQNRPTRCVLGFLLCMLLAAGGGLSASLIPAARRTARADAPLSIVKIMARPENYINLGVEINCGVATPQNGLNAVETSLGNGDWVPSDWQASLLINGKGIQNWGNVNAISIHANIDWGGLMTDGETSQTPEPPTPGKLWFHLGIAPGSLNMKNDGTDVLTIKKTFPAARQASGVSPDTLLDRDYHYRIIPASDLKDSSGGAASGYIFEEVNTPDYQTRQVAFPETSDGGSYTADGVFDTSYAIEKIVEGGLTGSDGYYYDGDGYASFMADTNNVNLQLALGDGDVIDASEWETADGDRSKINLEFWVLSNKAPESFGVGARQVQLSSSANPDNNPDVTYRWDAYSIYASPVYVPGVWNRMVFKLSEPWGGVSDHNNIDLSSLRFFRHYFVQDAPDADNRVFFSGIRLTESPTQSAVVEQAKVKQFVTVNDAPACVTGDTFTLSAEAVTRLPGFAAQDISDVVFTSDNSDVLTIEGDRATAVGDGVVTVTAMLPGNDKFAAATAQIEITVKKAQSPLEFDTDDGETDTHVFGAPYTLGVTGGSTAGVVTYSVVSDGSTGEGTVRDDILTVIKAGVLVIQATMAGDTEYGDVSCRLTLTVEKSGQAALMALCNEGT
ncbi:MAG: hypothetical protein LBL66_02145, partial [Clostridiales bacterium]|nr:hypothetical protein [Clostridiales bacterium]